MSANDEPVTVLLRRWRQGDRAALDQLMPLVYEQLHALAARSLRSERPGHTLQATALVNEAYLRLAAAGLEFQDRTHFVAVAAQQIRRILVDHARARLREKRGAGARKVTLDEGVAFSGQEPGALLEIDEALDRLAAMDARKAQMAEMMLFGGLTLEEAGDVVSISVATAHREWKLARAWLTKQLSNRD